MSIAGAVKATRDNAIGAVALKCLSSRWLALALLGFAIVQQCLGHQNADNSFQFTFAEKVLDGARAYVDIRDTNPPASFLLYMPAVLLARLTHLRVEFVVVALTFGFAIASIVFVASILRAGRLLQTFDEDFLCVAVVFALLVLPGFNFSEREHFAVIWLLPMFALYAVRMNGGSPALRHALIAGVLAGLAMCIKPYFAFPAGLAFAGVACARRSIMPAFAPENLIAAVVVLLYTASVFMVFPAFLDALPVIVDAYLPVRVSWLYMLNTTPFVLNVALFGAACLAGRANCLKPRAYPLLAGSAGFAAVYFWQGKGWMNHEYPAVALACLALATIVAPMLSEWRAAGASGAWRAARLPLLAVAAPAVLLAPLAFGAIPQWMGAEEHEGLSAAMRRNAPAHPKLMALSEQLLAGFPLVRQLDGQWVGRAQRLWLTVSARMLIAARRGDEAYRSRLASYIATDAADFLADVRSRRPDVILVDTDPRIVSALHDIPDLAAALKGYARVETADDLEIWTPVVK